MTYFYSIHAYDQESNYNSGEDKINNGKLYTTFEKACEEIERKIQDYMDEFHRVFTNKLVFQPPDREKIKTRMRMWKYVHYYEIPLTGWLWVISKWEVEEEKPKYLYQYFVEKEIRGTIVALKGSEKYSSLDEMLDVLQPEVHLDMRVPYSRQTIREYMERNKRMIYDSVDVDDEGTITYAIHKYET